MAKHRGKAFWSRHVAAAGASGMSRAAYCRRHGFNYKTFLRWAGRLGVTRTEESSRQSLVPLSVVAVPRGDDVALCLRVASDVELSIPLSIDARWLGELLRAVAC